MIIAREATRGAHIGNTFRDTFGRVREPMMTGGEQAVIAVCSSRNPLSPVPVHATG